MAGIETTSPRAAGDLGWNSRAKPDNDGTASLITMAATTPSP